MLDRKGLNVAPLARPRTGTWVAFVLFGLCSWWGLWAAAVEHTAVPNGFDWFFSASLVGIGVSRWLARYGAMRFRKPQRPGTGWLDSGRAVAVGAVLLIPGAAFWFALRVMLADRRRRAVRRPGTAQRGRTALWALWALAGTAGQVVMIWAMATNDPSTDLTPEILLGVASLLNAAAIATLMCIEPKADYLSGS